MLQCMNSGSVAQLVEQRPEEPCVTGSSPVGATRIYLIRHFSRFFSGRFLLSTLLQHFCNKKTAKNAVFTTVKIAVNTLNNLVNTGSNIFSFS